MHKFKFLFPILIIISGSAVLAAEAPKSKLEELFIWKMSDELSLKAEEERQFSEMVRDLDQRKADLNTKMQSALDRMTAAKTEKEKGSELIAYKKALQSYNRISEEEIDRAQKIMGVMKTAQYLQAKKDLTNRLKSLLSEGGASIAPAKKQLPAPKVIEQK